MNITAKHAGFILAASLGAGIALAAAGPAAAQSSFSFGVTVGNGGYSSPYYGDYYRYGDYYPYSRRANRACRRDPWCSGSYYHRWRAPVFVPAPVYSPPVVVYERRDRYDPLPRWRAAVPRAGYDGAPAYRYEDAQTFDYESAPSYAAAGDAPVTADGALRYDLIQRGYEPSDFAGYGDQALGDPQYAAPAVRYDQTGGAAESFIRDPSQDPDDLLLGGPE